MVTSKLREKDRERFWSIHDRDEYTCPDCGRTQSEHGCRWEVHHIDDAPRNIVGLCAECHTDRHANEPATNSLQSWKEFILSS